MSSSSSSSSYVPDTDSALSDYQKYYLGCLDPFNDHCYGMLRPDGLKGKASFHARASGAVTLIGQATGADTVALAVPFEWAAMYKVGPGSATALQTGLGATWVTTGYTAAPNFTTSTFSKYRLIAGGVRLKSCAPSTTAQGIGYAVDLGENAPATACQTVGTVEANPGVRTFHVEDGILACWVPEETKDTNFISAGTSGTCAGTYGMTLLVVTGLDNPGAGINRSQLNFEIVAHYEGIPTSSQSLLTVTRKIPSNQAFIDLVNTNRTHYLDGFKPKIQAPKPTKKSALLGNAWTDVLADSLSFFHIPGADIVRDVGNAILPYPKKAPVVSPTPFVPSGGNKGKKKTKQAKGKKKARLLGGTAPLPGSISKALQSLTDDEMHKLIQFLRK